MSRRFGPTVALDGVSLGVEPGTICGLVGPNGSGKTTALRVVSGSVRPDAGTVVVVGVEPGSIEARRQVAVVPDEPTGFDELTVDEFVSLVTALYGVRATAAPRASALVEAFGLDPHLDTRLGELSRGRRRQASYVAALASSTHVLVIDEATATLDPEAVVVVRAALLAHARRGGAVLLATQDLRFAETTCDEVTLLRSGVVVASGAPAQLVASRRSRDLEAAFLAATGREGLQEDVLGRLVAL